MIYVQNADFAMSRHLLDENYYISHAKKIPIKWTASEVSTLLMLCISYIINCITKGLHFKRYSTSSDVWSFGVAYSIKYGV